jgi:hypothetical protein
VRVEVRGEFAGDEPITPRPGTHEHDRARVERQHVEHELKGDFEDALGIGSAAEEAAHARDRAELLHASAELELVAANLARAGGEEGDGTLEVLASAGAQLGVARGDGDMPDGLAAHIQRHGAHARPAHVAG